MCTHTHAPPPPPHPPTPHTLTQTKSNMCTIMRSLCTQKWDWHWRLCKSWLRSSEKWSFTLSGEGVNHCLWIYHPGREPSSHKLLSCPPHSTITFENLIVVVSPVLSVWFLCLTSNARPFGFFFVISAKGWYMYIETSAPRVTNDTARLVSQTIQARTAYCFSFWYHMYGAHVNRLNVYIRVNHSLFPLSLSLFSLSLSLTLFVSLFCLSGSPPPPPPSNLNLKIDHVWRNIVHISLCMIESWSCFVPLCLVGM